MLAEYLEDFIGACYALTWLDVIQKPKIPNRITETRPTAPTMRDTNIATIEAIATGTRSAASFFWVVRVLALYASY